MGLAEMPDYRGQVDDRCALIAGGDDAKYAAIARALPAPVKIIAGSGHDPLLEQPAALAAALGRLLGPGCREAGNSSRRLSIPSSISDSA